MKLNLVSALTFLLPALFVFVGIPLMLDWIPPNRFYGFRTSATLASPQLWYPVNRSTGWALLIAGVLGFAGACVIALVGADWSPERRQILAFCWEGICVLVALAIVASTI
jgi:peptidoglycan/LPS O-acetylase OafA/YrhL